MDRYKSNRIANNFLELRDERRSELARLIQKEMTYVAEKAINDTLDDKSAAAGLDREALQKLRADIVERFNLCAPCGHSISVDVLSEYIEAIDAILALQTAPSTKIMKKPQCDGLMTCAAAKFDGVICPEDTCDWDTGVRKPPSTKTDGER